MGSGYIHSHEAGQKGHMRVGTSSLHKVTTKVLIFFRQILHWPPQSHMALPFLLIFPLFACEVGSYPASLLLLLISNTLTGTIMYNLARW